MMSRLLLASLVLSALASANKMSEPVVSVSSSLIQTQSSVGENKYPERLALLDLTGKPKRKHKKAAENKHNESAEAVEHKHNKSAGKKHKASAEAAEAAEKKKSKSTNHTARSHKADKGKGNNKSDATKHNTSQSSAENDDSDDTDSDEFSFSDHDDSKGDHNGSNGNGSKGDQHQSANDDSPSREELLDRVQNATKDAKAKEEKVEEALKDASAKEEAAEASASKLMEERQKASEAEEQLHNAEEQLQEVVTGSSTSTTSEEPRSLAASRGSLRILAVACSVGAVLLV